MTTLYIWVLQCWRPFDSSFSSLWARNLQNMPVLCVCRQQGGRMKVWGHTGSPWWICLSNSGLQQGFPFPAMETSTLHTVSSHSTHLAWTTRSWINMMKVHNWICTSSFIQHQYNWTQKGYAKLITNRFVAMLFDQFGQKPCSIWDAGSCLLWYPRWLPNCHYIIIIFIIRNDNWLVSITANKSCLISITASEKWLVGITASESWLVSNTATELIE